VLPRYQPGMAQGDRYMSEALGYKELFDQEFYSCRIGVMKPKESHFLAILDETGIRPGNALFLDDHRENVDSTQAVGIHAAQFVLDDGLTALQRKLRQFGIPSPTINRFW
jgi:putative hydrolase of the HAD superfamily